MFLLTHIVSIGLVPLRVCGALHDLGPLLLHIGARHTDQHVGVRLAHHVRLLQVLKIIIMNSEELRLCSVHLSLDDLQDDLVGGWVIAEAVFNSANVGWIISFFLREKSEGLISSSSTESHLV